MKQYYAKHKKTGEIFEHKGRFTFSKKGVEASIVNSKGTWVLVSPKPPNLSMTCVNRQDTLDQWEIKEVDLT